MLHSPRPCVMLARRGAVRTKRPHRKPHRSCAVVADGAYAAFREVFETVTKGLPCVN